MCSCHFWPKHRRTIKFTCETVRLRRWSLRCCWGTKCHHCELKREPALCQGEAALPGRGVIILEGCHHNGALIDSATPTPCLTPEALNPNCATQVTNRGPEANSSYIFIPVDDLTAAAVFSSFLPSGSFSTAKCVFYGFCVTSIHTHGKTLGLMTAITAIPQPRGCA